MNLADSMRSQDNINKVVFTGKRNIKDDGENIIYCLWIKWQIFRFADKINKLPEKKSMQVLRTSHKQKNMWVKRIFIYRHGTWKDNIRSVILDKAKIHCSLKLTLTLTSLCVFSSCHITSQKGSPPQKKNVQTLSDCIPTIHNRRCRRIKI